MIANVVTPLLSLRWSSAFSPAWLIVYFSSFVASQRIHLSWFNALICLIPFGMAFLWRGNKARRNTLLIAAIFLSVDNGGAVYSETPSIIRYSILLSIIWIMVIDARFNVQRIIIAFALFTALIVLTFMNIKLVSLTTLWRDLLLVGLLVVVFCTSQTKISRYDLDYEHLAIIIIFFLMGEIFNILSGATLEGEYLSYDSLKSLIVFPTLYLLSRDRYFSGMIIFVITFMVLLHYGTRMIPFVFMLVLIGLLAHKIFKSYKYYSGYVVISASVGAIALANMDFLYDLELFKFGGMIVTIIENWNSFEFLRLVDPVRYEEIQLFIARPFFEIVFGSGLGIGIADRDGLLDFVKYEATAFSAEELDSRIFHNFHDIWVDIGLRLGLWPLLIVLWLVMRRMNSNDANVAMLSQLLFILLFCAFFSSAGLISIAFVALIYRKALGNSKPLVMLVK